MNFKKVIILFFVPLISLIIINQAQAIDMPHIDKSKIRLYMKPGQAQNGEIIVENTTNEAMSMRVYPQDWYYSSGDGSKEFVPVNATTHSCASWISFSPAEFILAASSWQKIRYSIKAPLAASGGYYAVLFSENMVGKAPGLTLKQTVGVNLAVRFATLFYIEIEGTTQRKGVLDNLKLKKAGSHSPLLINANFKNAGNVDIIASGVFAIIDKAGKVHGRGKFDDLYTLAGDSAKLKGIWREPLSTGSYTLVLTMDLGKAGHKSYFEKGPFLIKEIDLEIAQDGSLSNFKETK